MSNDNSNFEQFFDELSATFYNKPKSRPEMDLEYFCKVFSTPIDEGDENVKVAVEKASESENKILKASEKQVGGDHYKRMSIQPAEYCQRNQLPFLESNVVKYVTRHRLKNGKQDIQKAIQCLELLLEYEYGT